MDTKTNAQQRLDAMIRKVEALIRKAERTTNEHEAEAFFAKAQQLMAEHGIDEAKLRLAEPEIPAEKILFDDMDIKRSGFFESMLRLAMAVADANNVRCLVKTPKDWGDRAGVRFVGAESDIAKTKMLYVSLLAQCVRARRNIPDYVKDEALEMEAQAGKSGNHHIQKWRRDFSIGFAARIGRRLREIQRDVEAAAVASDKRLLPVLADRRAEVDHLYNRMVGGVRSGGRSRSGPMADAYDAGGRAADRADLGQPSAGRGNSGALPG